MSTGENGALLQVSAGNLAVNKAPRLAIKLNGGEAWWTIGI